MEDETQQLRQQLTSLRSELSQAREAETGAGMYHNYSSFFRALIC